MSPNLKSQILSLSACFILKSKDWPFSFSYLPLLEEKFHASIPWSTQSMMRMVSMDQSLMRLLKLVRRRDVIHFVPEEEECASSTLSLTDPRAESSDGSPTSVVRGSSGMGTRSVEPVASGKTMYKVIGIVPSKQWSNVECQKMTILLQ